jgi:hypothetical protein
MSLTPKALLIGKHQTFMFSSVDENGSCPYGKVGTTNKPLIVQIKFFFLETQFFENSQKMN